MIDEGVQQLLSLRDVTVEAGIPDKVMSHL